MYPPSSDSRRLSRNQLDRPPPERKSNRARQDLTGSSMFLPGDPGGFVLPGPGMRNQEPLGFVLPGRPDNMYGQQSWSSAYPPMQPLYEGEPGGFIVPGCAYPRPQQPQYPPPQHPSSVCSSMCSPMTSPRARSPEQYKAGSRSILPPPPPPYSAHDTYPPAFASQPPTKAPHRTSSRQSSVCSRHSAGSAGSAATPTLVGAYTHPKASHPHMQTPKLNVQRQTRPAYTWDDVRYG